MAFVAWVLCLQSDGVFEKLRKTTVPYELTNATLDDVAEMVREIAQVNVVISHRVKDKIPRYTWFNVNLKGVRISSALSLMLEPLGLVALERDGVLEITVKEAARPKMVTRIYDVSAIQNKVINFSPSNSFCGTCIVESFSMGFEEETTLCNLTEDITMLIQEFIGNWDVEGAALNLSPNGMLMATHTRDIHKKIEKFLDLLQ